MKRRRFGRGPSRLRTVCSLGSLVGLAALASCHEIDTTRLSPYKATLGDDLYGTLCDRLGASSLTEDTSGASYQAICHPQPASDGSTFEYGNDVDESVLPPTQGEAAGRARARSIAKMRAMARWRGDLIRAFNAMFPDVDIDDVTTETDGDKIRLHQALFTFAQKLTPLYETNPFDTKPGAEPLFPGSTRALARALGSVAASDDAKAALSRVWGRQGYRPFQVGLGAVRSALGYPNLRGFTKASLGVLGPGGSGEAQLQQLFRTAKHEFATSQPKDSLLAPFRMLDAAKAQPERPRTTLEFTAGLFLPENDAYAEAGTSGWPIALRDRRGFAVPIGNVPGEAGTVPSPFADNSPADGFADVDAFGRFMDAGGAPLAIDPPFFVPGIIGTPEQSGPFVTIDTSKTAISAVARSLRILADPQNNALMDALAGAYVLYGPREPARYDYTKDGKEAILAPEQECPTEPANACLDYVRFKGEESPLVDLIYALGPVLSDPDSDVLLLGLLDLVENHEAEVARLLGAALKVRQIALDHDKLAEQGGEAFAAMPYQTPIWDEVAELMWKIVEQKAIDAPNGQPNLVQKVVKGFSNPVLISQQGGSDSVGHTLARFMRMRDEMTYNPLNLNGPAINLTDNAAGGSTADPNHPVDLTKPKTGANRSLFERTLGLIHDVNNVAMCNKEDAHVFVDVFGGLVVPGGYAECDLVQFPNLAGLYLDALLPDNHPKRAKLQIQSDFLNILLDFGGQIGIDPNALFENSSGITGLTLTPTLPALNRFVFFGAESGIYNMPDIDPFIGGQNEYPNLFISNLIEPAPSSSCPKDGSGLNRCNNETGTVRVKGPNTIFAWERLGFYAYLQPVVTPFAEVGCTSDLSNCPDNNPGEYYKGEQYFVDLIDILNRHWAQDGGNTYEPLLADAFESDLVPALVEFSKIATDVSKVTVTRGPKQGQVWTGADVLAKTARILFSRDYAAQIGLTDRKGNKGTTWTDGTPQSQVTVYSLFADALHGIDVRFDTACDGPGVADVEACKADAQDRKAKWKAARSRLVDEFLTVDGQGSGGASFRNKGTPKVLAQTLHLMRDQLNAHCPDREAGVQCDWARVELADKFATTLSGPLFAALMDLQEALRANEDARLATEQLLVHLLSSAQDPEAFQATLASFADVVQVLQADGEIAPLLRAMAPAMSPSDDPEGRGAADSMLGVLQALVDDEYDPYHVMDHVLPAAVRPMEEGANRAPLEIIIDAITDIHRIDAEAEDSTHPLDVTDYGTIFTSVSDFLTDETRGLEQFYFIVQNRPRE